MIPSRLLQWLSSRVYLALGLSSLAVTVTLVATFLKLVPDAEALTRSHRAALAETVALSVSLALDENEPATAQQAVDFVARRNVSLLSLGLRRADGTLFAATADHGRLWGAGAAELVESTDTQVVVPVYRGDARWGGVEIGFRPLRAAGWLGWLQQPDLQLAAFVLSATFVSFYLYLRRMLRHLDPSRAVPQRVRHALDTLTEGLLVLDRRGQIVLANQSLAAVLGVAPDALLGRKARGIAWAARDGRLLEVEELPWERALADGQVQRNDLLYLINAGGERSTFRTNCSPILGPDGNQQGVLVSLQDVTELEHKELALQAAKDEADEANQAKSRFLANMSHEIRTPMNAILGFTDVLRRGGLRRGPESARHLDIIHASGRHLLTLINDILDLSKVESGRLQAECIAYAPHRVAHEVVQTLAVRAQEKGLTLTLEFPQRLPAQIHGDPARLRQILTNLIGNALKFTEQGGVEVVLRLEGGDYFAEVRDSGIGIAPDKLESVFEPFVQAESSTTRRFGGTGLGLTISRGFARAMGGDITVSSVPGKGTTFSCRLPAGELSQVPWLEPAALGLHGGDAPAPATGTGWAFPSAHVLVVDDGEENRQLVRLVLEEAGLTVSEAGDGRQAVDRVAAGGIDLVLMDMNMPVMDGVTATRTLRGAGCRVPVLALTANAMKGYERELDEAGFDGHLTKPIDIDVLLQALAQRLGGRPLGADEAAASATADAEPAVGIVRSSDDTAAETAAASAAAVEPGDASPLRSRLAHNPKLGRLAERFAQQLPAKLGAMQHALHAKDLAELAALAHGLKGAGGSMGFDELFEPARDLEEAAKAGDAGAAVAPLRVLQALGHRIEAAYSLTELTTT